MVKKRTIAADTTWRTSSRVWVGVGIQSREIFSAMLKREGHSAAGPALREWRALALLHASVIITSVDAGGEY